MSVEIGESTQVGFGMAAGFAKGGIITGSPSGAVGVMLTPPSPMYISPYMGDGDIYAPPYSPSDPGTIPDSICPNCRRDRHDYPLTETVAEMWKSLSFDEDYDPASDVSRIVCPGSDVCGPVVDTSTRMTPGYYTTTFSHVLSSDEMKKYWQSFNADLQKLTWNNWYMPSKVTAETVHEWEYKPAGWTINDLEQLKGGFTSKELTFPDMKDVVADDLYAFAPVSQAAIEAAPKQIEHEAPQSAGFDFSNIKTAYPTYPTGKKKKK